MVGICWNYIEEMRQMNVGYADICRSWWPNFWPSDLRNHLVFPSDQKLPGISDELGVHPMPILCPCTRSRSIWSFPESYRGSPIDIILISVGDFPWNKPILAMGRTAMAMDTSISLWLVLLKIPLVPPWISGRGEITAKVVGEMCRAWTRSRDSRSSRSSTQWFRSPRMSC